ncbi:hypothetical protein EXIGLDRAFT_710770 [Exidia glandulosa HHB12029]|uniref:Phosphatidylserine decarboxylase proenzyme 2 n=1 Tax=Exidia glandulosa HHB12029 TaxID=1314781 RepID=A0A165GJH7_EXIGL|nr:hypothetical protein EXIGLDRAFT_710770 [Exidia glandulosa HHB12029]
MAPTSTSKKAKIGRVLKSAATSGLRLKHGRGAQRAQLQPLQNELPVVVLRVRVLGCKDILAKDKGGTSDPYVVLSLLRQRFQTPAVKRTLNPTWSAKDATFDFPIYTSLVEQIGVLELVLYDKDVLRKDYIGEASVRVEDWFKGPVAFDDPGNEEFTISIVSTKKSTPASGVISLKLGFVPPSELHQAPDFEALYADILKRRRGAEPSLTSAPPTEGMGTIRLNDSGPQYEDDGLSSDDELDSDGESPEPSPPTTLPPPLDQSGGQAAAAQLLQPPPSPGFFPKVFQRKTASRQNSYDTNTTPTSSSGSTPMTEMTSPAGSITPSAAAAVVTPTGAQAGAKTKRPKFQRAWTSKRSDYSFGQQQDVVGIVMLEIKAAEDLPKLRNITRTGWDMDPFCIIAFGRKIFRTRVIRHSLNPTWDEKLLFHVRRYETSYKLAFTVCDWDKLSSNDHVGEALLELSELLQGCPKPDPETGLYPASVAETHDMKEFKLPLSTRKDMPWEAKHSPYITVRAKYQPYDALRQRFWRQYLKQYDSDDTGTLSRLEITSMLDSLGSTLTRETIDNFFTSRGKTLEEELTTDEVIVSLEAELSRPQSEKKEVVPGESSTEPSSVSMTPSLSGPGEFSKQPPLEGLDFSGGAIRREANVSEDARKPTLPPPVETEPMQQPLHQAAESPSDESDNTQPSSPSTEDAPSPGGPTVERVINIRNCPLCHRPRLSKKGEVDIVTHLAVCASGDWGRVDRMMTGNYVTASQATRKWYTKVIAKVSSGSYQIGANSANIIVQNRMTGQLEEEKMQVYVRLGIRLLYKGAKSRMEGARARRLLKSMSVKQGLKFDSPESAREIPTFIVFHNLNVSEIREPITSFKTFNEFFYRKLKEDARPVADPDDPTTLVSAADCRMMTFETVQEAQKFWIKGREFTVARLLGDAYKDEAHKYVGGALGIFRLAPQDYHRFHSPVDGTIGPMTYIAGEYYTVNPQAIRTTLDVYGENARKIVPIDSPVFGRVMAVCIGAMMVGSILTTVEEGEQVKRGQEFGYFAFGGSTIVVLFEKGMVEWDEDLLINGRASLETLVRVGMRVGKGRLRS